MLLKYIAIQLFFINHSQNYGQLKSPFYLKSMQMYFNSHNIYLMDFCLQ